MSDLQRALIRADKAACQAYQFDANSYSYEAISMIMGAVRAYQQSLLPPHDYELWFTGGEPIRN
jgi:hypothetical protein